MQRAKEVNERGEKLAKVINEAIGNKPNSKEPDKYGWILIHFEMAGSLDGTVGYVKNCNEDDASEIMKAIVARSVQ